MILQVCTGKASAVNGVSETIRSASTVDEAVARTCVGDAYGTQTAVSAISRGREGRLGAAAGGGSTDDADAAECF